MKSSDNIGYKKLFLLVFGMLIVMFSMANVSAGFWDFLNTKSGVEVNQDIVTIGNKDFKRGELVKEYPVIDIKGFGGLGKKRFSGAITEHTSSCSNDCESEMGIYLDSDDVLIEDIRFVGDKPKDYVIKVQDGTKQVLNEKGEYETKPSFREYETGTEVSAGNYRVKIEGSKSPFEETDWQIKTQGKWLEEWAVWSDIGEVTLNSPADGSTIYNNPVTFNATGNITSGTTSISNMSLYTNESGSWGLKEIYNRGDHILVGSMNNINLAFDDDETTQSTGSYSQNDGINAFLEAGKNLTYSGYFKNVSSSGDIFVDWDSGAGANYNMEVVLQIYKQGSWQTEEVLITDSVVTGDDNGDKFYTFDNETVIDSWGSGVRVACDVFSDGDSYSANYNVDCGINETTDDYTKQSFKDKYTYNSSDNIKWNVETCDTEGTCGFATSDYTFTMDDTPPTLDIQSPNGTYDFGEVGTDENLNYTVNDTNLDTCWYEYNGTNTTLSSCENTTFSIADLGAVQELTVYANDSLGNLQSETASWEYDYLEYNRTFNEETFENQEETFEVFFETSTEPDSVSLEYGGNSYETTQSTTSRGYKYSTDLFAPEVSSDTNKSFYWNIDYSGGEINTSTSQQLVKNIEFGFDKDSDLLNVTIYDEITGNQLNETELDVDLTYWFDDENYNETFFGTQTSNESYLLGTTPSFSGELKTKESFSFNKDGYQPREYLGDLVLVNGSIQELKLYLLETAEGTTQLFNVYQDTSFELIEGAEIKAYELSGGEEIFRDAITTDSGGSGNLWLNPDEEHKITVEKEGCAFYETSMYPTGTETKDIPMDCEADGEENVTDQYLEGLEAEILPDSTEIAYNKSNSSEHIKEFKGVYSRDDCNITSATFSLIDVNGSIINSTTESSNDCSGEIIFNINITKYEVINGKLSVEVDGDTYTISKKYTILDISDLSYVGSSIKRAFDKLSEMDIPGIDQKTKPFIALIGLFLLIGSLSLTGVVKSEGYPMYLIIIAYLFIFSSQGWFYINLPEVFGGAVQETLNKWVLFVFSSIAISGIMISQLER